MVNVFIQNKKYVNHIEYVFNTIFFILGIKCIFVNTVNELAGDGNDLSIVYLNNEFELTGVLESVKNLILIKDSGKLFGANYLKVCSIPINTYRYRSCGIKNGASDIISIYNDGGQLYILRDEGENSIKTNIDIISDIFFMLTRYEEVVKADHVRKDRYDRFPAMETLAYRENFLNRPVVNEHTEMLWSWIDSLNAGCERRNWWGPNTFAACLSHDVDHVLKNENLSAALKHTLAIIIRFGKFKKAFDYIIDYFRNKCDYKKDPYWTFNYILDIEKQYDIKSSFYFMASEASDPDFRYDVNGERIRRLISELEVYGCEVGYHGSLCSYNNKKIMGDEKKHLDGIVHEKSYGCRQHYLKFQMPLTWRYQQQSGILYDTTLSFAEKEGFRCGVCFPYKPYDLLEDEVLDIWEIPLIVMDGSLQSEMYGNLLPEEGLDRIKSLIETVKRYRGTFSLLWHNSSFDYNWDGWSRVFEETVKYLGESNCICRSGRELIEYMERYSD